MKSKILLYSILLIFFLVLASTGCQNKVTNVESGSSALVDDGYVPDSPKWNAITPIDVQKIGEKQFQVILDWEPVTVNSEDNAKKNIIGYNIYRRKESAIDKKIASLGTDQHYYIDKSTELIEGEKFIYTVSAFDNMLRESPHTDVQLVIIQAERKSIPKPVSNIFFAPGNQIMSGHDRGEIIISWDAPTENIDNSAADDIDEYEIESHKQDNSTWKLIAKVPADKNIFIDSNLVEGTYFYRIRAKNTSGNYSQYMDGNFSIYGKIDEMAPGQITNIEIWYQKGKNYLTWQNPKKDADGKTLDMHGVKIYRKDKNSAEPYSLIKIMPPDTKYTDFNINLDLYYIYVLSTYDISGNESIMSKPVSSEPKVTYLETPQNLYAKLDQQSKLTINWDAITGAKKYIVFRSPIENGIYTRTTETPTNSVVMTIPYGNSYYFKIAAADESGNESSLSNSLQVISDVLYKTIEAEEYLGDISKGVNAISRPFDMEVNVIDYAELDQKGAYLKFSPISPANGESVRGVPLSGIDVDAVNDYFELNEFMMTNPYKCEVWIKKGVDCGIYQIEAAGNKFGPVDCYSVNNREIIKFPINFNVADDATNHGQTIKFRFTCTGKNQDSTNYTLNLDKIVIFK